MSEVNKSSVSKAWGPPLFPLSGRLPSSISTVTANYKKQTTEEDIFCQGINARGQKRHSDCCHSLHISLFFDGTNNNDNNDTQNNHPSNIAKLFHASLRGMEAEENGYFSFYMPGVGTPFPEIGELDYSSQGLMYATGGEDRINWALVQVASALSFALNNKKEIDRAIAKTKVEAMSTWKAPLMSAFGARKRRGVMEGLLNPLKIRVERAKPRVLGVKLFVYGFSRGAAEARTFVTWLSELFDTPQGAERPVQALIDLPVSVEFLGVLDTVASVGIAHAAPFFAGHMDWADDTQLLPDAGRFPRLIKCCRHFVAGFEQRSCFPLDSIRNEDGQYPADTYEVVYPGVHSDVGGAYSQNEQGKTRGGTRELVSQIVLHDLYAAAFSAGAPLQVPEAVLPKTLFTQKPWRVMTEAIHTDFDIDVEVITRFNAWRNKTLLLVDTPATPRSDACEYNPPRLNVTVEDALASQLGWITGWRIGRYANDENGDDDSYRRQPFFTQANEMTADEQSAACKKYQADVKDVVKARVSNPLLPGPPSYEPQIDRTQLSQAAAEFKSDYMSRQREQTSTLGTFFDVALRDAVYLLNENDERKDHATLRALGKQRSEQLFRDTRGTPSADPDTALLVSLFDDQIHDSRAWFMFDALTSREMWTGYFFYRMTYFGNDNSRDLSPVVVAGRVLGVAMIAGATVYGIKRGGALGGLGGLAGGIAAAGIGYQVIDKATGLAIPFLPEAAKLLQPTGHIGQVAAEQKRAIKLDDYVQRIEQTNAMLRKTGSLVEHVKAVVA